MKILIFMAGFFPGKKYGGPPVSVDNFCSLMSGFECFIVTRNHDMDEIEEYKGISGGWNDRNNCKVKYLSDSDYKKTDFEKIILDIKPDIIYLQGLFQSCVLPCLSLAKKHGINVILALRGEVCANALAIRKFKKVPYIYALRIIGLLKNVSFQSTSAEETAAIHKYLKVPYEKIHFLPNIPSIPAKVYPRPEKKAGSAKFIFLSRIHPKKNLLSAIHYFGMVSGNVKFDIYGPVEDEGYWKQCQVAIKKLPENINVNYCGLVSHDEVCQVFSRYDAFLFPTLSENYGHVIAESLCVGTPVITSDQTPWTDIDEAGAGRVLPLDKNAEFANVIQEIVDTDDANMKVKREKTQHFIQDKIAITNIEKKYRTILESL